MRRGKESADLKNVEWVVDGGISPENVAEVSRAGADVIVVGRSIFKDGKITANITALRHAMIGFKD